jgi:hypothetical protein
MSPLKLVRPTIAPDVIVDAVSAKRELEQHERVERDRRAVVVGGVVVQEEERVPDDRVADPELEREADRPVEDPAQARVEDALHHHVDGFLRPREARFQRHEPGLHEEDQERGDEHPHGVHRADEVGRLRRGLPGRRARRGLEAVVRDRDHGTGREQTEHLPREQHAEASSDRALLERAHRQPLTRGREAFLPVERSP